MILSFEELSQYLFTIGSYRELEGVIASLRELEDNTFFRMLLRLLSSDQLLAYNSL